MNLSRPLASYAGCTAEAVSSGSVAQMAHFVTDAKRDIAALADSNADLLDALKKARGIVDATIFNLHDSRSPNSKRSARIYAVTLSEIDAAIAKAEGKP